MDQRDRDVLSTARAGATRLDRRLRPALAGVVFALVSMLLRPAAAEEVARLVPAGVQVTPGRYAPAGASQDPDVRRRGAELDRTLAEAVEDMGLAVEPLGETVPADSELAAAARGGWVFAPRFELRPGGALIRIVAVAPGERVLLVREEDLEGGRLSALAVRTVVMVRDLIEAGRQRRQGEADSPRPSRVHRPPPPPRSSGRPVLAFNAALFGGYVGFTMQRASDSRDSRLAYPMVALGAGLGLGASLLAADEWNITQGDAWYLSAAMIWPGAAGFLIAESYGATLEHRHLYALVGATSGIGLGTIALATGGVNEGGAVLSHSGGAFGMLFGALTEVAIEGKSEGTPTRGMGFGTAAGTLAAGLVAIGIDVGPERVLFVDLSASLGALGGAALASPLLFVDESDATRTRVWLGAVAGGAVTGGIIGWLATSGEDSSGRALGIVPYATRSPTPYGGSYDVGVVGRF